MEEQEPGRARRLRPRPELRPAPALRLHEARADRLCDVTDPVRGAAVGDH